MQRAMAKQAEAEREKRAKIIHAEGEFLASIQLSKASDQTAQNPVPRQLRPGGATWPGGEGRAVTVLPVGGPEGGEGPEREPVGVLLLVARPGHSSFPERELASAREFLGLVAPAARNVRLVGELRE